MAREIKEIDGYVFEVKLTEAGRKKVEDTFDWHYRAGWLKEEDFYSWCNEDIRELHYVFVGYDDIDICKEIEWECETGLQHPEYCMNGEDLVFVENIDYVIEWKKAPWHDDFGTERLKESLEEFARIVKEETDRIDQLKSCR